LKSYSYEDLRNLRTLVLGEISTGKTRYCMRLLREAYKHGDPITVLDFAPPRRVVNGLEVGGRLYEPDCNVVYLYSEKIHTPRLSASNKEELERLVSENRAITNKLIKEYLMAPTPVLFINDLSIHLQGGGTRELVKAIEVDHGSGVSDRERLNILELMEEMDLVINLKRCKN